MRRAKIWAAWAAGAGFLFAVMTLAAPSGTALAQPNAISRAGAFVVPAAPAVPAAPTARDAHSLATAAGKQHSELIPVHARVPLRMVAYDWALKQRGCWYQWGGVGPCRNGFDCSGLVMEAYRHAGVDLERTTYEMLGTDVSDGILVPVRYPKTGDLAFYGSGHVELFDRPGYTLGAHDSGTRVSVVGYSSWWHPTGFYRVRKPAHR